MTTKILKSIKGRVARLTRLDECGSPIFGLCSTVVTAGFITVTIGNEVEAGEEFIQKNAWGEFCINEKDPDITKWANVSIQFCEVNPDVLDIIASANPVVFGADTIGATFGPQTPTGSFAIEVWTKRVGLGACTPGGTQEWGYFVVPFIVNGQLDGEVTIENAPLNFTLMGEGKGASADWGVGPHQDNPLKAITGFPAGDFWGYVITDVQPPAVTVGCVELVEPPAKGAVEPGDTFAAEVTITGGTHTFAALLAGLGYIVDAAPAWAIGEFFTVGVWTFYWNGTQWVGGNAPDILNVIPTDQFGTTATITAEDAPRAALLAGLGFVSDTAPAWGAGTFFTIGAGYRFNWGGAAWDFGPA